MGCHVLLPSWTRLEQNIQNCPNQAKSNIFLAKLPNVYWSLRLWISGLSSPRRTTDEGRLIAILSTQKSSRKRGYDSYIYKSTHRSYAHCYYYWIHDWQGRKMALNLCKILSIHRFINIHLWALIVSPKRGMLKILIGKGKKSIKSYSLSACEEITKALKIVWCS